MNLKDFCHIHGTCQDAALQLGPRPQAKSFTLMAALPGEEDALCLPHCYAPKFSVVIVSPSRFLPKRFS